MSELHDIYQRLRAPAPTPAAELCTCPAGTPIKLMSTGGLGYNPIHCLDCNLEVAADTLPPDVELVEAVANWRSTYGAIDALELDSGPYEAWARSELLDPNSPPNLDGRAVVRRLNALRRCYFWFWQPESDDDFRPRTTCPVCDGAVTSYTGGIFRQLLCERCSIVLVG